jgi:5'-3' exonuclease
MEEINELDSISNKSTKSFKDLNTKDTKTWLIVDALNLAFRYLPRVSNIENINVDKVPDLVSDFFDDYYRTITSIANSYKAGNIIITADQGNSIYRRNIYPEYKKNRKDKYDTQHENEKLLFNTFFNVYESVLLRLSDKFLILRYQGVEADDIAAYIVQRDKEKNYWLLSSDKDWDILIDSNISRFSYVTRKETTVDNWDQHYPCNRANYVGFKCLQGDTGDNIIGVKGIGPKRAADLLIQYCNLDGLIDNLPLKGKQKYIQELNASKDTLVLNKKLIDIKSTYQEAIGINNIKDIDERLNNVN